MVSVLGALAAGPAAAALPEPLAILRAKPATVLILTQIGGQVRARCGAGPFQDVAVPPFETTGTGFIVHPDGWIITNGHVVQRYHEQNEDQFRQGILRAALARACLPPIEAARGGRVPSWERAALLDRMATAAAKDATVTVRKTLTVVLPGGTGLPAEVKICSEPIAPHPTAQEEAITAAMGKPPAAPKGGRDIAVLKVSAAGLPVVRLGDSRRVRVGDPVHIIGYPGVVLRHELLAQATRTEPSVTGGSISAIRRDAQGYPVLQTDAPVSWGNSGGPMLNSRGEAIGVVTFISLADGGEGQAIQGFNFAVPSEIVREVARPAAIDFDAPSPFNALWDAALEHAARGFLPLAAARLEELSERAPDHPDVARFLGDVRARFAALPFYRRYPIVGWGAIAASLGAAVTGVIAWARRARRRRAAEIKRLAREEVLNLIRAGTTGGDLAILDVRSADAVSRCPFCLPGAIRVDPDAALKEPDALPAAKDLVLYCDCPDDAASAAVAQALKAKGFANVKILRGGLKAWMEAGLPTERAA